MKCELCKKLISRKSSRKVEHHNIMWTKEPIIFCSKKCYEQWKSEIHSNKLHKYLLWNVRSLYNKYEFVPEKVQIIGLDFDYGIFLKNSHFSKNLINKKYREERK